MQGVTRDLAIHTGRHFVHVCSRIRACGNSEHLELFFDYTHSIALTHWLVRLTVSIMKQ